MERERTTKKQKEVQEEKEKGDEVEGDIVCPECGSSDLLQDSERAELVCDSCGLVVEQEQIDPGPEWRAFDQKERNKKSRVGAPTTKRNSTSSTNRKNRLLNRAWIYESEISMIVARFMLFTIARIRFLL